MTTSSQVAATGLPPASLTYSESTRSSSISATTGVEEAPSTISTGSNEGRSDETNFKWIWTSDPREFLESAGLQDLENVGLLAVDEYTPLERIPLYNRDEIDAMMREMLESSRQERRQGHYKGLSSAITYAILLGFIYSLSEKISSALGELIIENDANCRKIDDAPPECHSISNNKKTIQHVAALIGSIVGWAGSSVRQRRYQRELRAIHIPAQAGLTATEVLASTAAASAICAYFQSSANKEATYLALLPATFGALGMTIGSFHIARFALDRLDRVAETLRTGGNNENIDGGENNEVPASETVETNNHRDEDGDVEMGVVSQTPENFTQTDHGEASEEISPVPRAASSNLEQGENDNNSLESVSLANPPSTTSSLVLDDEITEIIRCPISLTNWGSRNSSPVIASDGNIYEEEDLVEHLKRSRLSSPMNREKVVGYAHVPYFDHVVSYLSAVSEGLSDSDPQWTRSQIDDIFMENPVLDVAKGKIIDAHQKQETGFYIDIHPWRDLIAYHRQQALEVSSVGSVKTWPQNLIQNP